MVRFQLARHGAVGGYHAALAKAGLGSGDRVAVQLPNGINWVAFDIAAMAAGLITVPLYMYDSVANATHIRAHSGAKLILVDTWERWGALAALCEEFPAVKHVWVRETNAATSSAFSGPAAVTSLADALPTIADAPREPELDPYATATHIYKSGTAGLEKGVMLTHFAILWNCEAASKFIPPFRSDVFLSFLPLADAFERTPTLKVNRRAVEEKYREEIDLLYADLKEARERPNGARDCMANVKVARGAAPRSTDSER